VHERKRRVGGSKRRKPADIETRGPSTLKKGGTVGVGSVGPNHHWGFKIAFTPGQNGEPPPFDDHFQRHRAQEIKKSNPEINLGRGNRCSRGNGLWGKNEAY